MRTSTPARFFPGLIILIGLYFGASGAHAQGILLPTEPSMGPLELRAHEVEFRVDGQAAVTKVTHRFSNPNDRPLEATFYFPIPAGATTTDFAIWMNGERIEGSVMPRDEARQIYEQIVRRLRDPGLLEYVNGTLFQARIFPVPPRGEQTVEIEYAATLARNGNVVRYHYPVHTEATHVARSFSIHGEVRNAHGVAQVYSPHYAIDTNRESPNRLTVGAELQRERLTHDFELFITPSEDDVALSLLTWDGDDDEDGYFMVSLTPSQDLDRLRQIPREITFVVDTSGSMAGQKMEQARELLEYCIGQLGDADRFNVVTFASSVNSLFEGPVDVSAETRARALRYVRDLEAAGGTNIDGAMRAAMEQPASSRHASAVFFVTDGLPTSGERDVPTILRHVQEAFDDDGRRLFAFGVGYDVNTRLLDGMASRGTGRSDYVRPGENLRNSIGHFFDSVSAPLLTDVSLDFGTADVFRVFPERPEVLYKGDELILFGRYRGATSTHVTLSGRTGGRDWSERYPATFGETDNSGDRSFIGNLWANRRVASLLKDIDENGENEESIQAVVQLATRWNIVTPYTSYLAVDPSEQAPPQPPIRRRVDGVGAAAPEAAPAARGLFGARDRSAGSGSAQASSALRVERSIARNSLEESESLADVATLDESAQRRVIAGRSFVKEGEVWTQQGIGSHVDRRITYLSDEYFTLVQRHPELRSVFALGDRLRLRIDGKVVEIEP